MSETDESVTAGRALPKITTVVAVPPTSVEVTWASGRRGGRSEVIDLSPILFTFKMYKPLRYDPDAFARVKVAAYGSSIAWGEGEEIDVSALALERLAEQKMDAAEFKAWMKRCRLTLDSAAAQLGVGRRSIAYYASGEQPIPRVVSLACALLERR